MNSNTDLPGIPGYVSIKEAAKILGISDKTVYYYVEQKRLAAKWAADVIVIPLEELERFKLQPAGRPRKNTPPWRISSGQNTQHMTIIHVQIKPDHKEALLQKLETIRQRGEHLFPGTVTRSIANSETQPDQIIIVLTWRIAVMPDENSRKMTLTALQQSLEPELDWNTATYNESTILMHT